MHIILKSFFVSIILSVYSLSGSAGDNPKYNLPLYSFNYHEDFEAEDPFVFWASNGSYTVNYKGLDSSRASSGRKSFKLDITIDPGTYVMWYLPINKFPSDINQSLIFSGDIFVEHLDAGRLALLTNVDLRPPGVSGTNLISPPVNWVTDNWFTQTSDMVLASFAKAEGFSNKVYGGSYPDDFPMWTDRLGLQLYSGEGGRFVVYVDNVSVAGTAPDPAEYQAASTQVWESYLDRTQAETSSMIEQILGFDASSLDAELQSYWSGAKSLAESLQAEQQQGAVHVSSSNFSQLEEYATQLTYASVPMPSSDSAANGSVEIYPWNPTSSTKILPTTYPIPTFLGDTLSLKACPGEFEPASFIIRAQEDIPSIEISVSDFTSVSGADMIPSDAVDISLVKSWYQNGDDIIETGGAKTLTPELLLKDDSLVAVDESLQTNRLRIELNNSTQYLDVSDANTQIPDDAIIRDAPTLQSFALDKGKNKQVWLTVHVPDGTRPGIYNGRVALSMPGAQTDQFVELELNVLPFTLAESVLEQGIYYRGAYLAGSNRLHSDGKNETQLRREMQDLFDHGITHPTFIQGIRADASNSNAKKVLSIRKEIGFPADSLYIMSTSTDDLLKGETLSMEDFLQEVREWPIVADPFGYTEYYFYGVDEAFNIDMTTQIPIWKAIHEEGHKNFVALTSGAYQQSGGYIDAPVINCHACSGTDLKDEEHSKWRSAGKKTFIYSYPQVGIENPGTYRRNYGFRLWCEGFSGSMNYAYQHSFGHIWNDFDSSRYRDHVFSYPTSDGLVGTIQWEGFREAVDDVRYLSTYLGLPGADEEGVRNWLCPAQLDGDLDEIRGKLINLIVEAGSQSSPHGLKSPPAPPILSAAGG